MPGAFAFFVFFRGRDLGACVFPLFRLFRGSLPGARGGGPGAFKVQRFKVQRITGSAGSTLQIANVQTSDAGNYRLRVSNQAGLVDSGSAGRQGARTFLSATVRTAARCG